MFGGNLRRIATVPSFVVFQMLSIPLNYYVFKTRYISYWDLLSFDDPLLIFCATCIRSLNWTVLTTIKLSNLMNRPRWIIFYHCKPYKSRNRSQKCSKIPKKRRSKLIREKLTSWQGTPLLQCFNMSLNLFCMRGNIYWNS